MNSVTIEPGRFYKTIAGEKVRIYAMDGYMDEHIHGAIYDDLTVPIIRVASWNSEGRVRSGELNPDDIIGLWDEAEKKELKLRSVFIELTKNGSIDVNGQYLVYPLEGYTEFREVTER